MGNYFVDFKELELFLYSVFAFSAWPCSSSATIAAQSLVSSLSMGADALADADMWGAMTLDLTVISLP